MLFDAKNKWPTRSSASVLLQFRREHGLLAASIGKLHAENCTLLFSLLHHTGVDLADGCFLLAVKKKKKKSQWKSKAYIELCVYSRRPRMCYLSCQIKTNSLWKCSAIMFPPRVIFISVRIASTIILSKRPLREKGLVTRRWHCLLRDFTHLSMLLKQHHGLKMCKLSLRRTSNSILLNLCRMSHMKSENNYLGV